MTSQSGLKFSKWAHALTRGNVTALVHSLTLAVVYVSDLSFESVSQSVSLESFSDDTLQELQNEGILVPIDTMDEETQLYGLREGLVTERALEMMYLMLHDGCNLKCRYCFEDALASQAEVPCSAMSDETIEYAIETFSRLTSRYGRNGKERIIHLYGGEPLMNRRGVRHAIKSIRSDTSLPSPTQIAIVTNGTLVSTEDVAFFKEYEVTVGLSVDGPEALNNLHRVGKKVNLNTHSLVVNAYNLLRDAGVPTGLSVTLTPEVVADFDAVLRYFLEDLKIQDGVSFNILHYNPSMQLPKNYFRDAADCMVRAFEVFCREGIYEERMMRKARAFIDRKPIFADCGVVGHQIVVAPDGSVGVCQDFIKTRGYYSGSVHDPAYDPYNSGLFREWEKRSPLYMEACMECVALGICGGGCPASVESQTGSRWNIDPRACAHSLSALEWLVWSTYENMR